jgi:hypothetical protein
VNFCPPRVIGEVNAGTLEFINLNIYEKKYCTYGITATLFKPQNSPTRV